MRGGSVSSRRRQVRQCLDAEAVLTHKFKPTLTRLGALVAHPTAFIILVCYVGVWLISDPRAFDWQAVATIATLLMTLFIQRAEHRDTQAIHAKLDELLRAEGKSAHPSSPYLIKKSPRPSCSIA